MPFNDTWTEAVSTFLFGQYLRVWHSLPNCTECLLDVCVPASVAPVHADGVLMLWVLHSSDWQIFPSPIAMFTDQEVSSPPPFTCFSYKLHQLLSFPWGWLTWFYELGRSWHWLRWCCILLTILLDGLLVFFRRENACGTRGSLCDEPVGSCSDAEQIPRESLLETLPFEFN